MKVAGKIICEGRLCFLCKDHGKSKQAHRFCIQCSDYLCKTCFENHKKWRVSNDHTFGSETETSPEVEHGVLLDYDKCSEHVNESIKFYCTAHDQVGCGDCMIVDHKPCTVEYVSKKADVFMDSQEHSCFVKRISKCQERANQLKPSTEKSKEEITVENDMFVKDVHKFKDEIIACVKQLADTAIQESIKIKMRDTKITHDLEIQRKNAGNKINATLNDLGMLTAQPNKLFVTAIQQKPILNEFEHSLDDIERRLKIEHYYFVREPKLERVLKDSQFLGILQRKEKCDTSEVVFITVPCSSPATIKFVEQFKKTIGIPIEPIDVRKVSTLKQEANLIVVCNNVSQIMVDIAFCLKNIDGGHLKKIVLVLHVGRKDTSYDSNDFFRKHVPCKMLKDVRDIVDMTFNYNIGIHRSDMNTKSLAKLTELLRTSATKVTEDTPKCEQAVLDSYDIYQN